ncbi:MAG: hypothetical protein QGH40_10975, partial [bacterium]|nr:hypothetical protein [bacterium]
APQAIRFELSGYVEYPEAITEDEGFIYFDPVDPTVEADVAFDSFLYAGDPPAPGTRFEVIQTTTPGGSDIAVSVPTVFDSGVREDILEFTMALEARATNPDAVDLSVLRRYPVRKIRYNGPDGSPRWLTFNAAQGEFVASTTDTELFTAESVDLSSVVSVKTPGQTGEGGFYEYTYSVNIAGTDLGDGQVEALLTIEDTAGNEFGDGENTVWVELFYITERVDIAQVFIKKGDGNGDRIYDSTVELGGSNQTTPQGRLAVRPDGLYFHNHQPSRSIFAYPVRPAQKETVAVWVRMPRQLPIDVLAHIGGSGEPDMAFVQIKQGLYLSPRYQLSAIDNGSARHLPNGGEGYGSGPGYGYEASIPLSMWAPLKDGSAEVQVSVYRDFQEYKGEASAYMYVDSVAPLTEIHVYKYEDGQSFNWGLRPEEITGTLYQRERDSSWNLKPSTFWVTLELVSGANPDSSPLPIDPVQCRRNHQQHTDCYGFTAAYNWSDTKAAGYGDEFENKVQYTLEEKIPTEDSVKYVYLVTVPDTLDDCEIFLKNRSDSSNIGDDLLLKDSAENTPAFVTVGDETEPFNHNNAVIPLVKVAEMPLFEVVKVYDEGPNGTLGVKVYDSYIEDGQWKDRTWTNDEFGETIAYHNFDGIAPPLPYIRPVQPETITVYVRSNRQIHHEEGTNTYSHGWVEVMTPDGQKLSNYQLETVLIGELPEADQPHMQKAGQVFLYKTVIPLDLEQAVSNSFSGTLRFDVEGYARFDAMLSEQTGGFIYLDKDAPRFSAEVWVKNNWLEQDQRLNTGANGTPGWSLVGTMRQGDIKAQWTEEFLGGL